jgi:hypothetical protein
MALKDTGTASQKTTTKGQCYDLKIFTPKEWRYFGRKKYDNIVFRENADFCFRRKLQKTVIITLTPGCRKGAGNYSCV